MWRTSEGNRTLSGCEALLVSNAITFMAEQIVDEQFKHTERRGSLVSAPDSIPLFDDLDALVRLNLLELVATHLLRPTSETLELTAVNEATVGAIYRQIRHCVQDEVDADTDVATTWRQLVLDAFDERYPDDPADWHPQSVTCIDHQQWGDVIESLADQVLWDRDYELSAMLMDQPAELANSLKAALGIESDYFVSTAPAEAAPMIDEIVKRFERICQPL